MEYLLRKVKIIDPGNKWHLKTTDVLIVDGIIKEIKTNIVANSKKTKELQISGSCLSLGWVDVGTTSGEPGNEHRETLESLAHAAMAGGYTHICCFPNTQPVIHSKSEVKYIRTKSQGMDIEIHPLGAITKETNGQEMAEMLQMHIEGAVGFSDGANPVKNAGMLSRALQYNSQINPSIIVDQAYDPSLSPAGQMHEGEVSTYLGLRGIPSLAEHTAVQRNIEILKYSGGSLLIHKISAGESVQAIKKAKTKLNGIKASVSIFNLAFSDQELKNFDVHFKLNPPLRLETDRKQLIKGLEEGTIDIICSDHTPWDPEKKDLEFQQSAFGVINLETSFSISQTFVPSEITPEIWVEKVAVNPRKIFSIYQHQISPNQSADLCWFHPSMEWTYETDKIQSLSKNTPFIGKKLRGKVLGVFSKNKFVSNYIE